MGKSQSKFDLNRDFQLPEIRFEFRKIRFVTCEIRCDLI